MRIKLFAILETASLAIGMVTLQACIEERYVTPPPAYAPVYQPAPPVVVGDYDEGRVWHDRDWWMNNRRDWVEAHHREWVEHHEPEERREREDRQEHFEHEEHHDRY